MNFHILLRDLDFDISIQKLNGLDLGENLLHEQDMTWHSTNTKLRLTRHESTRILKVWDCIFEYKSLKSQALVNKFWHEHEIIQHVIWSISIRLNCKSLKNIGYILSVKIKTVAHSIWKFWILKGYKVHLTLFCSSKRMRVWVRAHLLTHSFFFPLFVKKE